MSEGSSKASGKKKKSFYFSHDQDARHDPNIQRMMTVYKATGYGWFWMLLEMMRQEADHRLRVSGEDSIKAIAHDLHTRPGTVKKFIADCVKTYDLFQTDGESIWNDSLDRRMEMMEEVSLAKSKAANARWDKNKVERSGIEGSAKQSGDGPDSYAMQQNQIEKNKRQQGSQGYDREWSEAYKTVSDQLFPHNIWAEDNERSGPEEPFYDDGLFYVTDAEKEDLIREYGFRMDEDLRNALQRLSAMFHAVDFHDLEEFLDIEFPRNRS